MTLEELLNKLIEKGWKPFWKQLKDWKIVRIDKHWRQYFYSYYNKNKHYWFTNRQLVSKESWLWQFVCENRKRWYTMPQWWIKNPKICDEWIESVEKECNQNSYEYYIIESALKDESELEQFLLDNIKIKW